MTTPTLQPPTPIRRFRKKPVVIEAIQFTSEHLDECVAFCGGEYEYRTASQDAPYGEVLHIKTLKGTMTAVLGDWIIKGVKCEFYPCKPDIFEATYEPANLAPMSNVSETPRTDAAIVESILCTEGGDEECTVYPCVEHVESDFARQLERELAEVTKERDAFKAINDHKWYDSEMYRAQLAAVVKERDTLRDWQESALSVLNEINFQEIGKALGVGLGALVPKNILPGIRALQEKLVVTTIERDDFRSRLEKLSWSSDATVENGIVLNIEVFRELVATREELQTQLTAALARAEKAEEALRPLAAIADAWDANKLDDEARKHYGVNLEFTNMKNPDEIELYTGRGGKRLLTLADCLAARAALTPIKEPAP